MKAKKVVSKQAKALKVTPVKKTKTNLKKISKKVVPSTTRRKKMPQAKKPQLQKKKTTTSTIKTIKQKKGKDSVKKENGRKATPIPSGIINEAQLQALLMGEIAAYHPKKNEKYMSSAMREHFRKVLFAWRDRLLSESSRTVTDLQENSTNYPDLSDRATQEETFSFALRERDRERKLLKKIEIALQKLDEGEYGYCESCGEEIGLQRLEVRPTATLCIDCKLLDEIREKQIGNT
jgi:DnaK suppressor protein